MITTDASSKIRGVSLSKLELVVGGAGDMSFKVKANLVSQNGEIHGVTERVGGWPESVIESVVSLIESVESHLLSSSFDTEEGENGRTAERNTPAGILGS